MAYDPFRSKVYARTRRYVILDWRRTANYSKSHRFAAFSRRWYSFCYLPAKARPNQRLRREKRRQS